MKERFSDIADLKFTANMEQRLVSVEEGATPWKSVLRDFYGLFDHDLKQAEQELDGVRIKVPDEVSEEICPECGRNLVIKSGHATVRIMNYLLLGGCWIALVLYGFTKSALALSVAATLCGVLIAMFIIMLGVNLYYERRG